MARAARSLVRYLRSELQIPGLLFLAHSSGGRAVGNEDWAGLDPHVHDGWEISWFHFGMVDWWTASSQFELGPGWCFAVPPGVRHGSATGILEPCDVWWMQFNPALLAGMDQGQRRALFTALRALPAAFPAGDLLILWQDLLAAVKDMPAGGDRALAILHAQSCLLRLLTRILAGSVRPDLPPPLLRAMRRVEEGPASVLALARAARCSEAELTRLFRRTIGDSPGAWLRRRKISMAKRSLAGTTAEITGIAHDLGFASSQQFATCFRQFTGLTPTAYRRLLRDWPQPSRLSGHAAPVT